MEIYVAKVQTILRICTVWSLWSVFFLFTVWKDTHLNLLHVKSSRCLSYLCSNKAQIIKSCFCMPNTIPTQKLTKMVSMIRKYHNHKLTCFFYNVYLGLICKCNPQDGQSLFRLYHFLCRTFIKSTVLCEN